MLALLVTPPAVGHLSGGWSKQTAYGSAYVSANRRSIEVCDLADDGRPVEVEYATSMLNKYTITDSNGAKPGCGDDFVLFGHIDVFKLCDAAFPRECTSSTWIKK
ncbi:hypothetical protein [Nonomuraea typhae]|uniref:hypothetical protein n=1 Tax=Nonomuraea typhae TaxID=2603600 RepID=UPI0012F94915|nr:hypothetical protein [Nonomuraea typhae]